MTSSKYSRKDTRTLKSIAQAVAKMRKEVAAIVAAHENEPAKNFVIFYKWVGSLEEQEYKPSEKFQTIRALERHLEAKGNNTDLSYFRYGVAGSDPKDMALMYFN